jgi:dGTPase
MVYTHAFDQARESLGYSEADRERFLIEPAKRLGRTEFARDRARIIHSFALRRLAAKTQLVVPWLTDFPRTRLSHSLECAQVGRELGAALGADPDLMEGACLAHDIGHPPFGHNGEDALNALSGSCGGFEGNAQSFRLLVRLEAKTVDDSGRSVGLNLTRASLDAATKYPWPRAVNSRKFGVYDDDVEIFNWVRLGAPVGVKSMEAQIMDWSDDVAYSVHDFEDSLVTGQVRLEQIHKDLAELFEVTKSFFMADITNGEVEVALANLQNLSCWPKNYDGSHRHLARLKDLASQLVGRFAVAAESATREQYGHGPLTRFSASLIVPREQRIEVALLKSIATYYVINASASQERYAEQQKVIRELLEMVAAGAPATLDSFFQEDWRQAQSPQEELRVIVDQIASLTDPGAYAMHRRLSSIRS